MTDCGVPGGPDGTAGGPDAAAGAADDTAGGPDQAAGATEEAAGTRATGPGPARAGGHGGRPLVDDRAVPWRVFLFVGAFIAVIGVIYWATAYEESGVVMLLVAGGLGLWIAAYLWLQLRGPVGPTVAAELAAEAAAAEGRTVAGAGVAEEGQYYLPHASAWPFAIGLGAATVANGLVLGLWVIVPGAALMALGIGGFVRQTRRRD